MTILSQNDLSTYTEYPDSVSRDTVYSDIDLRFSAHPISGDIITLKDVAAIKRSLSHLLLTNPGERPFNPKFGTPLGNLLFEPFPQNAIHIRNVIELSIKVNEPRVSINSIELSPDDMDDNTYNVTVLFYVKNIQNIQTVSVKLKRTR